MNHGVCQQKLQEARLGDRFRLDPTFLCAGSVRILIYVFYVLFGYGGSLESTFLSLRPSIGNAFSKSTFRSKGSLESTWSIVAIDQLSWSISYLDWSIFSRSINHLLINQSSLDQSIISQLTNHLFSWSINQLSRSNNQSSWSINHLDCSIFLIIQSTLMINHLDRLIILIHQSFWLRNHLDWGIILIDQSSLLINCID